MGRCHGWTYRRLNSCTVENNKCPLETQKVAEPKKYGKNHIIWVDKSSLGAYILVKKTEIPFWWWHKIVPFMMFFELSHGAVMINTNGEYSWSYLSMLWRQYISQLILCSNCSQRVLINTAVFSQELQNPADEWWSHSPSCPNISTSFQEVCYTRRQAA